MQEYQRRSIAISATLLMLAVATTGAFAQKKQGD
jgi:hypothetical protein